MPYKHLTDYSDISPFAECPSCAQLIKLKSFTTAVLEGSRDCPFCHSLIEKKDIISSCEANLKKTKAIQSAQDILYMYFGLLIVFGESLIISAIVYFSGMGKYNFLCFIVLFTSILILLGGFLSIQGWLSAFEKLQTTDKEFITTRNKIRQTQTIWVWAIIIYSILIIAYIKFL